MVFRYLATEFVDWNLSSITPTTTNLVPTPISVGNIKQLRPKLHEMFRSQRQIQILRHERNVTNNHTSAAATAAATAAAEGEHRQAGAEPGRALAGCPKILMESQSNRN